jgi:hypothetical protein
MKQVVEVSHSCITDKVDDFIGLLDTLQRQTTITRTKCQFDLVTFGIATAGLTLTTCNAVQISKLENKIAANNKKVDHLIDITNLHEQHIKAINQKLDGMSDQLSTMLQIHKVHFAKVTDPMEQKFVVAVTILERLIYTAYNHWLTAPQCSH